jgi:O-acetylhomoserine/O-acetylserine sulfhydrylase-like pyridoxal-dependent enzyme
MDRRARHLYRRCDRGRRQIRLGSVAAVQELLCRPRARLSWLSFAETFGNFNGANIAFAIRLRVLLLRDLGPAVSPFNSFLVTVQVSGGLARQMRPGGVHEHRRRA